MKQLIKNTSDENEIREAKIKAKLQQDQFDNSLKAILATSEGQTVLWKILSDCRLFQSSFTGSSETFFLEGKRSVGLMLLADIMRIDPEAFIKMQKAKKEFN